MIYLSFRLDDPSPVSDKEIEKQLIQMFCGYSLPLTMAVVPFIEKNNEKYKLTRETSPHLYESHRNGDIEVLLHGHSHKPRAKSSRGIVNEFAGLPKPEQHRLIKESSDQLEIFLGSKVDGFVPPWNTYDTFTLQVLNELKFKFISAGYPGIIRHPDISVIPATANLKTARKTIQEAMNFKRYSPVVVINFHPDDFSEHRDSSPTDINSAFTTLQELNSLLKDITINNEIKVIKLKELATIVKTKNTHISEISFIKKLPWGLRKKIPERISFKSITHAILGVFSSVIFNNNYEL